MNVKVYLSIFMTTICYAQDQSRVAYDNSGAYIPDDEGKYIPDDSGKYIPDYSGLYHPDGTGKYFDDGSGKYKHIDEHYQNSFKGINLLSAGTVISKTFVKPNPPRKAQINNFKDSIGLGKFDESSWKIIRQLSNADTEGYHWEYETENKISAEEYGKLQNKDTDQEALRTEGFYKYTGPDNVIYSVAYTADENGFIPQGDHLPVSLKRALAYIATKKA